MEEALHGVHTHEHSERHPQEDIEHDGHLNRVIITTTISM